MNAPSAGSVGSNLISPLLPLFLPPFAFDNFWREGAQSAKRLLATSSSTTNNVKEVTATANTKEIELLNCEWCRFPPTACGVTRGLLWSELWSGVGALLGMRSDDNQSKTGRVIDGVTFLKIRLPKQAEKMVHSSYPSCSCNIMTIGECLWTIVNGS